ncbi:Transcriptional regulator, TetR family [Labilithrix luteola]|uniref:Transcriptional regulator, TetR family n=1 Tax=Labilithrix luteola TaxID=1391654 RepID=A0A0K1PM80_9BACT|nr:TetR/AcrR family transcriptional regulator [Labilithrix luteola]AKU94632.1 Transcriptional regulator, TetR family [Labilithrix luteola]
MKSPGKPQAKRQILDERRSPSSTEPTHKRGRPRSFDRDEALNAALGLFWRHGYDATSLNDLTAAMNVTPPSLYTAFGSKKQLFIEALDLYARTYGASPAMAEATTARGAIEGLLRESAKQFPSPDHPSGCFTVLAATNCTEASSDVEALLRTKRLESEAGLRKRLDRAVEEGELPEGTDTAALAKFYGVVIQGMSVQARDGASNKELERVVDTAMALWPGPAKPSPKSKKRG